MSMASAFRRVLAILTAVTALAAPALAGAADPPRYRATTTGSTAAQPTFRA
jgi:hypothetical protein